MLREFDVREKGRAFFHQIYGMVSSLSGFTQSFQVDNSNHVLILMEKGFVITSREDAISKYRETYEKYSKLWYEAVQNGYEVFINEDLKVKLTDFWGYAIALGSNKDWNKRNASLVEFEKTSREICDALDTLLGLPEKKSRIPKWLNPREWRRTI
jgi:hypothetical protein